MKLRSRPRGRAHRAWIRENIVAYVRPGCMLPTGAEIGRHLGICQSEADQHLKRVLAEHGIETVVCGVKSNAPVRRRKFVTFFRSPPLPKDTDYSTGAGARVDTTSSQQTEAGP